MFYCGSVLASLTDSRISSKLNLIAVCKWFVLVAMEPLTMYPVVFFFYFSELWTWRTTWWVSSHQGFHSAEGNWFSLAWKTNWSEIFKSKVSTSLSNQLGKFSFRTHQFFFTWLLIEHLLPYSYDLLCSYIVYLRITTKCFMAVVVNPWFNILAVVSFY